MENHAYKTIQAKIKSTEKQSLKIASNMDALQKEIDTIKRSQKNPRANNPLARGADLIKRQAQASTRRTTIETEISRLQSEHRDLQKNLNNYKFWAHKAEYGDEQAQLEALSRTV